MDRTDDLVYHNVMTLVEAVLELKNKLGQLPPEDYVVVVKVTDRVEWVREVGSSQTDPRRKTTMPLSLTSPVDPRGARGP